MIYGYARASTSAQDLANQLDQLKAAGFKSLADAWADTTTPHGKLLVTMLGGMAELERSLILARTCEGRRRTDGLTARSFGGSASTISRLKAEMRT